MKQDTVILYHPQVDYRPHYSCFWAPLSILSVAAPLITKGIKVILLDGNLGEHKRDEEIVKENITRCICVGVSSMIGGRQLERALDFAMFVKTQRPNLPVIFGGPLPTVIPSKLLASSVVDVVVRGQGEKPLSEIVDFLSGGSNIDEISILGVVTRHSNEVVQPILLDKNIFPPYPWQLLDIERYIRTDYYLGQRVLNYVSSQGCPYQCGYCSETSIYGHRWKALTAQRTLEEIQWLKSTYHLDGVKFYDANFFTNPSRVIEFANRILDSNIRLKWGASAHPRDIIRLASNFTEIKRSGLSRLLVGAESGSQTALNHIGKGCTIEDNLYVAEFCANHHIAAAFTFIVGIPGIEKDINTTLDVVLKMKKISREFDIKIHFYTPFPGTSLFEEAQKFGYCPPDTLEEWSHYDYYRIQTPWVDKKEEIKVRRFGDFYCDFLYPPAWFLEVIRSQPISRIIYKVLRKLAEIRYRVHFYDLAFEMRWFKKLTGKETFQ